jgi:methylisocitrate lyase
MGYSIVIYPLTAFRAMMKNIQGIYNDLYREGTQKNFMERLMTRREFYDIIGYDDYGKEDSELNKIR